MLSGPQPPVELIAVDSEGVAGIIRNNQSNAEETDFTTPFVIDSRNSTAYYIEADKVFGIPFNNPQNSWVRKCGLPHNTPSKNTV